MCVCVSSSSVGVLFSKCYCNYAIMYSQPITLRKEDQDTGRWKSLPIDDWRKLHAKLPVPKAGVLELFAQLAEAIYDIQYTIHNIQYTIYNIQYTIYNIQYTYNI